MSQLLSFEKGQLDLTRTDTPYNMEDKTDSLSMALTQSVIKCISGF